MAAIANLTVKKADGTTDIVYTAVQPASGDNGQAVWRQENAAVPFGVRPTLKMNTRDNGNAAARKIHLEFGRPSTYTDTTTGLVKQSFVLLGSADFLLNKEAMDADIAEAVHQFTNLLVNTALRDSIKAGIAPT